MFVDSEVRKQYPNADRAANFAVDIDEVYLKLQHEVAAAHRLREKYG